MKSKDSSSLSGIVRASLLGLAILACLAPQPAAAQAVSGTILGTVKDAQGAAVAKAKVTGEVLGQIKGEKVLVFKHKKRKNYRRTVGHRQLLTRIRIKSITAH